MPQSLSRILLHLIFSTKDRAPVLTPPIRAELNPYLSVVLSDNKCPSIQVGGVEDHLHLCFGLARALSIAQAVEIVKTSSSKWIKTKSPVLENFHWQAGYGVFSVGQEDVDSVCGYIRNQVEHHRTITFQEEFRGILERNEVSFDERYVWD